MQTTYTTLTLPHYPFITDTDVFMVNWYYLKWILYQWSLKMLTNVERLNQTNQNKLNSMPRTEKLIWNQITSNDLNFQEVALWIDEWGKKNLIWKKD